MFCFGIAKLRINERNTKGKTLFLSLSELQWRNLITQRIGLAGLYPSALIWSRCHLELELTTCQQVGMGDIQLIIYLSVQLNRLYVTVLVADTWS